MTVLFLKQDRIYAMCYVLLACTTIIFLLTHYPDIYNDDAQSYIHFENTRPLIYPLFLWMFRWAGSMQFVFVMWLQATLIFSAMLYARYWLKKNLQLSEFIIFIVCCIIFGTIVFRHELTQIGPKGLAFPLFIIICFFSVECGAEFDFKKLIYLSALINVLILLRLQFYYFYVILGFIYLLHFWKKNAEYQRLFVSILLSIAISASANMINRVYHYIVNRHFSSGLGL